MLSHGKYILQIAVCCSALVALQACNTKEYAWLPLEPASQSPKAAESILAAEQGDWRLLDEETFHSPLNDHMSARSHVDTSRRYVSRELRAAGKLKEARKRTLILVRQGKEIEDLKSFKEMKMALLLPEIPTKPDPNAPVQENIQVASVDLKDDVKKNKIPSRNTAEELQNIEPAASEPGDPVIASVRFGDHPNKTRMVVDVTNAAAYSHSLDNETGIMMVQIDGAGWNAGLNSKLMQHPLILGYRAQRSEEGTLIALKLKKPAMIKWSTDLPPEKGKKYRLIFDIVTL